MKQEPEVTIHTGACEDCDAPRSANDPLWWPNVERKQKAQPATRRKWPFFWVLFWGLVVGVPLGTLIAILVGR